MSFEELKKRIATVRYKVQLRDLRARRAAVLELEAQRENPLILAQSNPNISPRVRELLDRWNHRYEEVKALGCKSAMKEFRACLRNEIARVTALQGKGEL